MKTPGLAVIPAVRLHTLSMMHVIMRQRLAFSSEEIARKTASVLVGTMTRGRQQAGFGARFSENEIRKPGDEVCSSPFLFF